MRFRFDTLLQERRSRSYSHTFFEPYRGSSVLRVPKVVPRHIGLYFDYVAQGLNLLLNEGAANRKVPTYLGFAKHALQLPKNARFILLQHEQTHFNPHAYSEFLSTPGANHDPAVDEVIHGVRLHGGPESYDRANAIVEYSRANISNVMQSPLQELYAGKTQYVAPLFSKRKESVGPRKIPNVFSMFGSPHLGRRGELLDNLRKCGIEVENLQEFDDYCRAFKRVAILLNISQKSYLQTPEELRLLPALIQEVVVITERNVYLEEAQYRPYLVETTFDTFAKDIFFAQDSYFDLWTERFSTSSSRNNFHAFVEQLQAQNRHSFERLAVL